MVELKLKVKGHFLGRKVIVVIHDETSNCTLDFTEFIIPPNLNTEKAIKRYVRHQIDSFILEVTGEKEVIWS